MAESAPPDRSLSLSSKNLASDVNARTEPEERRMRASSEISQETTSRYIPSSQ